MSMIFEELARQHRETLLREAEEQRLAARAGHETSDARAPLEAYPERGGDLAVEAAEAC